MLLQVLEYEEVFIVEALLSQGARGIVKWENIYLNRNALRQSTNWYRRLVALHSRRRCWINRWKKELWNIEEDTYQNIAGLPSPGMGATQYLYKYKCSMAFKGRICEQHSLNVRECTGRYFTAEILYKQSYCDTCTR